MEDRKARLAALAARAGRSNNSGNSGGAAAPAATTPFPPRSDSDSVGDAGGERRPHRATQRSADEPADRDHDERDASVAAAAAPPRPALKFRNYTTTASTTTAVTGGQAEGRSNEALDSYGDEERGSAPKRARRTAGPNDDIDKTKSALERALEKAASSAAGNVPGGAVDKGDNDDEEGVLAVAAAAAPKKLNWDLKRDIQPKLDKLERRTQRAIVQLLQERLNRDASAATSASTAAEAGDDELD